MSRVNHFPNPDDIDSVSEGIDLFDDGFLEMNGELCNLSLNDARGIYRQHGNYYELSKPWTYIIEQDPIFLIRFAGNLYAHDGQHRINTIVKYGIPTLRAFVLDLQKDDFERFKEKGWGFNPSNYSVPSENDLEIEIYG